MVNFEKVAKDRIWLTNKKPLKLHNMNLLEKACWQNESHYVTGKFCHLPALMTRLLKLSTASSTIPKSATNI